MNHCQIKKHRIEEQAAIAAETERLEKREKLHAAKYIIEPLSDEDELILEEINHEEVKIMMKELYGVSINTESIKDEMFRK